MTPLLLGLLAGLLAGPVPRLLVRVTRTRRTPRAAMLLWQGVALAAVLAALGAGASLATGTAWRDEPGAASYVVAGVALLVTGLVLGRLLLSAHLVGTRLRTLRRRHRDQVDLVAHRFSQRGSTRAGVVVLDHDLPVAYCLPGMQKARVVVSAGALGRLDAAEVDAVLAHERAHLRARHDLVLEAFSVLHRAFPRWVSSAAALAEVRLLVEVLADRAAVRSAGGGGRRALGRALVELAGARAAGPGSGVTLGSGTAGPDLVVRVRLLADTGAHRVQASVLAALAAAVLAVPTTFVVGPWLTGL
ncbi:M56 family metallopeptidase [Nocardioides sp. 1609]|uniref:M56 family metallopeptidase n=1 Tax=Nocardioides sp. 1609 TaxID=2508327 RepID=UPI00106F7476|nr:M56 family metallopeptidase [Nocardioides sp. 1609]